MKANCKALKLSIAISLISFIIIFVLAIITLYSNCKILEIILNIFIGVFGSGCVALLLSIPSYNVSKRQLLEKFLTYNFCSMSILMIQLFLT